MKVQMALVSWRALLGLINTLSLAELKEAMELESATERRAQVMRLLINTFARVSRELILEELLAKYNMRKASKIFTSTDYAPSKKAKPAPASKPAAKKKPRKPKAGRG